MTAGADSRLIVATLNEEQLVNKQFYTSNLSFLDRNEDRDVIGANLLASTFNLKHTIEKISFYENQFNHSYFEKEREQREKQVYGGWHGGELLSGFCIYAAPINKELTYKEVDEKFKSVFSWWYRFKIKKHPYTSYIEEKNKYSEITFMLHQLTRSFFTNIYGGTRGHWVQPYQLMNQGYSPFWDSRFLQKLIVVPLEELNDYKLYNEIFKLVDKDFTSIPSNSPITNRSDNVIPKLEIGIEPKHQIPNTHHQAYLESIAKNAIWKLCFYNKKLKNILKDEFNPITKCWLDFEMWHKYVSKK